jgi:hypothetical protein
MSIKLINHMFNKGWVYSLESKTYVKIHSRYLSVTENKDVQEDSTIVREEPASVIILPSAKEK